MTEKEDHIKKLFNEKLKGFEPKAPDSMWSRIDGSLSQASGNVFVKKQQNNSRIIKWTAAAVSVAAMLGLILLMTDLDQKQDITLSEIVESSTNTTKLADETQKTETPLIEELYTQEVVSSSTPKAVKSKSEATIIVEEEGYLPLDEKVLVAEERKEENLIEKVVSSDVEATPEKKTPKEREDLKAKYEQEILNRSEGNSPNEAESTKKKSGLSVGMNSRSNFALLNTVETAKTDEFSLPQLYTKKEPVEFRHYQPISIGLSVSKEIFRDIRAEVGLSYIYATSRVKSSPDAEYKVDDRQVFHYMALPVSLSYRFASVNKFKFQVAVGGSVQKDFYGLHKGKVPSVEGLENPLPDDKMVKKGEREQDHPQFSINGTLGVAYPLYKKLHIYTSAGWAYYFDAGNQYKTIYSDRPHQVDINLGLRYDF